MAEDKKVKATTKTATEKPSLKKTPATKSVVKKAAAEKPVAKKSVAKVDVKMASASETKVNVKAVKNVKSNKKEMPVLKASPSSKLQSTIFEVEKKYDQAIFDVIISERASRRQATHKTKSRAEVSGTGKKPFRQKGTGNARAGTLRAPHMVGGGVALGPKTNRNYTTKVNKAVRRHALNSALAYLKDANAVIVDDLKMEKISTKALVTKLASFNADKLRRVLIISDDLNLFMSARNLPFVKVTKVTWILIEDLVQSDALIINENAIKYLEGLVG
ncbi:large subunit ribosomal protein L4 [Mycoplasma testudineum]|uniref:Large ribosomal subunit protein uL4 n=1 Tax=Mycoplasma testudineum TaxID=244584 RepID=A0A4R6IH04_9MOLU|nr:50S ribosomal protein L4 [Mycoplasma testudineum]OYD27145.1 50S ribosomal protein L4 [Mycoplasma testudineum]TDO21101.1 large subunit ribosomal protein L4 [Mycoplasma testudineum]